MISFPNAKINIGLNVLEKREDGYHTIESIFYPINWCDAIEALTVKGNGEIKINLLGTPIQGPLENNLCYKAFQLLNEKYTLPSVNLWLLKNIPMGAGLGGGSADAAFFLSQLNKLFALNLSIDELQTYATQIGSDCTFFIQNKPAFVNETGNIIHPIAFDLSKYYISVVYPSIHIETKNAYSLITPHKKPYSLKQAILSPIGDWKELIVNDFEEPLFKKYPQLSEIKNTLYKNGALYASMTGSGSAIYGIFDKKPYLSNLPATCKIWNSSPA